MQADTVPIAISRWVPRSWLEPSIGLNSFGVEAHQSLLQLRAPLRVVLGCQAGLPLSRPGPPWAALSHLEPP